MRLFHAQASNQVDPFDIVATESRQPSPSRPWVVANMVSSLDGSVTDREGRSGGLSGSADRALFHALRGQADVVLAGANTVRVENYGAPRLPPEIQAARVAAGRPPLPRLAVVSASLQLDDDLRLLREAQPDQPPLILTTTASQHANPDRATKLTTKATLIDAGETTVDWTQALHVLGTTLATQVLLVEGGPQVLGQLLAQDLVDEICLTISPMVTGAAGPGIAGGPQTEDARRFTLDRVLEDEGFLLLRYLRHGVEKLSDPAS